MSNLGLGCASLRGLPHKSCTSIGNQVNLRLRLANRGRLRVRAESPIIEEVAGRHINAPVFNQTRWTYHQNTGRYARHLESIFRSFTFRNLQGPLSAITMVSCLVVIYRTLVELEKLPDLFAGVSFTDVPFQLTSFALSLLLVFRTDASYSRWCAAMDAWGTLRNSSSQLVRKAAAWVDEPAALQRLARWVNAYPLSLMVELRHDQGTPEVEAAVRRELGQVLRPYEVEQVVTSGPYYHQFCLSVLTALVEATQLGEGREASMLDDLLGFNQAACECEKILRFPIPLTYTRHTSRFMLIYLTSLPLALYDSCDWAVVPVTLVMAFLLLGIEDIGVQIEEPFSILPLPDICADLRLTAQRVIMQRSMVRCLADPDTCPFDPDELEINMQRTRAPSGTDTLGPMVATSIKPLVTASSSSSSSSSPIGGTGDGNGNWGSDGAMLSSKAGLAVGTGKGLYTYGKELGLVAALDGLVASGNDAGLGSSGRGNG